MKRIFLITGVLVSSAFLLSSFSLSGNFQDPLPGKKKKEKHIKLVKVDDDGNKMELDTILTSDDVLVWNGDTIGGDMSWTSDGDFDLDSLFSDMDFDFSKGGKDNVFVLKSKKGGMPKMMTYKMDGDSTATYRMEIQTNGGDEDNNVMVWHGDKGLHNIIAAPKTPGVPAIPPVPDLPFFEKENSDNIIDLADPGIISYKKKKMKDGREKITIIRNEPSKKQIKKVERIVVDRNGKDAAFFPGGPKAHKMMVVKVDDEDSVTVDGEDVLNFQGDDETVKIIQKDGKTIRIKEIKKGDSKNVEVEVEVDENQENN